MTVRELTQKTGWQPLTPVTDETIASAYVCDLLSLAMANARAGTAWVTIQSHVNVVAVASLTGCACVVVAGRVPVSDETLAAARARSVCMLSAPCAAYGAAVQLSRLGVGEASP